MKLMVKQQNARKSNTHTQATARGNFCFYRRGLRLLLRGAAQRKAYYRTHNKKHTEPKFWPLQASLCCSPTHFISHSSLWQLSSTTAAAVAATFAEHNNRRTRERERERTNGIANNQLASRSIFYTSRLLSTHSSHLLRRPNDRPAGGPACFCGVCVLHIPKIALAKHSRGAEALGELAISAERCCYGFAIISAA